MKRDWTKEKAISYLISQGGEQTGFKTIINKNNTWKGLKACSAADYLINHHGMVVQTTISHNINRFK